MAKQLKATEQEVNPKPRVGTPAIQQGIQGHDFGAQFGFDVNKQLGKLETGLQSATDRLSKVEVKLDQVQIDIACLKTTTTHIETLLKSAVSTLRGIAGAVGVFLLGILTLWLKHKFNL